MPIQSKSIWQQISNPRETYTDGYGATREVYEPDYITVGRKIYNGIDKFLNGSKTVTVDGVEMPITTGAGALELMNMPVGLVGKLDDVAVLSKKIDSVKDKWDGLRRFQLRRKVNRTPAAKSRFDKIATERFSHYNDPDEGIDILQWADDKVHGNPWVKQRLEKDRLLDPLAKEYNAAIKAGDTQKASDIKHKMAKMVRESYDDPYTNNHFWEDVNTRLFDTKNGGPGLTPKEKQTLLLDVEFPW